MGKKVGAPLKSNGVEHVQPFMVNGIKGVGEYISQLLS